MPVPPVLQHLFQVTVYPPTVLGGTPFLLGCSSISEFSSDSRIVEFDEMTSGTILTAPERISLGDITLSRAVGSEDNYQTILDWHYACVTEQDTIGSVEISAKGPRAPKGPALFYTVSVTGWITRASVGPWNSLQTGFLNCSFTIRPLWASWRNSA